LWADVGRYLDSNETTNRAHESILPMRTGRAT
jgi:hypothetical protein